MRAASLFGRPGGRGDLGGRAAGRAGKPATLADGRPTGWPGRAGRPGGRPDRRRPAGFRRWSARRADGRTPEAAGRSGGPTELRQRIQAGLWAGCKRAAGQAAVRPHGQRWAAGRPAGRPAKATRPSGSVLASQLNF